MGRPLAGPRTCTSNGPGYRPGPFVLSACRVLVAAIVVVLEVAERRPGTHRVR